MSRAGDPQPHISAYVTIQPKKDCVPDQHCSEKTEAMLSEYSYNKRPKLNINDGADDTGKSLGLVQSLEPTFLECYTKDRWTRLQTRRHTGANITDSTWSSFQKFQSRVFVDEELVAPDDGENIVYNGKLLIGGQGGDTRTFPQTNY